MKKILLLALLLGGVLGAMAQSVDVKTYTYTHRGEEPLYLDVYSVSEDVEPCLLYVFGGAFVTGCRDEKGVVEVYEYFARRGWKVVSIDYRLGLKPLIDEPEVKRGLLEFRSMLIDAIDIAAEDLLEATAYLVSNAKTLGINPEQIVTLGASAGAITALQAEWAICSEQSIAAVLPADFNYAGVISMAGAICAKARNLDWKRTPCPMLLFHGNADRNVPYGKQSLLGMSLFGSSAIAESLKEVDAPYWFYTAVNMDHNFSWRPMYFLRPEIERFAEKMAFGGEKLLIDQVVVDASLPEVETKFSIKDYIEANFNPNQPRGADAVVY